MIIGIVGYSDNKSKTDLAKKLLKEAILEIANPQEVEISICSGLTNLGIPSLAYEFALEHDLFTIGVACEKAKEYECFPVDEEVIVGDDWGDESEMFLSMIDAMVMIGGGEQSQKEAETFKSIYPDKPFVKRELTRDGE